MSATVLDDASSPASLRVEPAVNGHWERAEMPFELAGPLAATLHEALGPGPARRCCTALAVAGATGEGVDPVLADRGPRRDAELAPDVVL